MNNTEKLYKVVADLFRVEPAELNEDSSQDTIPNWDSLGMVNLISELEQTFGVEFDLLEIADFKTVGIIKSTLADKGVEF